MPSCASESSDHRRLKKEDRPGAKPRHNSDPTCTRGPTASQDICSTFRGGGGDGGDIPNPSGLPQIHDRQFNEQARHRIEEWGALVSSYTIGLVHARIVERHGDGHCLFYSLLQFDEEVAPALALRCRIAEYISGCFYQKLQNSSMSFADILRLEVLSGLEGDLPQIYRDVIALPTTGY